MQFNTLRHEIYWSNIYKFISSLKGKTVPLHYEHQLSNKYLMTFRETATLYTEIIRFPLTHIAGKMLRYWKQVVHIVTVLC